MRNTENIQKGIYLFDAFVNINIQLLAIVETNPVVTDGGVSVGGAGRQRDQGHSDLGGPLGVGITNSIRTGIFR